MVADGRVDRSQTSGPVGLRYTAATPDLDGDGKSDLVWEESFGTTAMWLMDGLDPIGYEILITARTTS
jgi:hypothetical protein